MAKLPTVLSEKEAGVISDLRYNGLTWKEIAAFMNTSASSCIRAYKWYEAKEANAVPNYSVMVSSGCITIINRDTNENRFIREESTHYETAYKQLHETQLQDDSVIHNCFVMADVKDSIEVFSEGRLTVDVENETIMYDGKYNIPATLNERIISMIRSEDDGYVRLLHFMNKLLNNPSARAVQELYTFLEAADIEIDAVGDVVCYKKVDSNFKDIHTGTFDNNVGVTVEMPRHLVTDDSNITCAPGLHVCAKSYLNYYGSSSSNKVVKVSVDPADFVSIPTDYNNSKARVSKYVVIADVTGKLL